MSEARMRGRVIKALKSLHARPVENRVDIGTPDVNYTEGWIELKQQEDWPKRESTILTLRSEFTIQQRQWHIDRAKAGGTTWVLLQVRQEWLLYMGPVAAILLGRATKQELYQVAFRTWSGQQMDEEISECLSSQRK